MSHDGKVGLRELEALIRQDLEDLAYPSRQWVIPKAHISGQHVWNVVILGGGMSGLAVGFGLVQERVNNFLIVDRSEPGKEGPWMTYARMRALRTDKMQSSIDCGIPSLHFNKYYIARFGYEAWTAMSRCPTSVWMDYLNWYRNFLGLPVRNGIEIIGVEPDTGLIRLKALQNGRTNSILCRKLIVATGYDGAGGPDIPLIVSEALPRERYFHSTDVIDFKKLKDKKIGVIGCGASAFDNAAAALEAGAKVQMIARTSTLKLRKMIRTVEYSGLKNNFREMSDLLRWRFARHIMGDSNPPPPESGERAMAFSGFSLHLSRHMQAVKSDKIHICVETNREHFLLDHLILGTGFYIDVTARQEFSGWENEILLWQDAFTPPQGEEHPPFDKAAFLGPAFELAAKDPERAPHLRHIYDFSWGAWPSMGPITAGVSGMPFGLRRLLPAISRSLFVEDAEHYWDDARDWTDAELRSGVRNR